MEVAEISQQVEVGAVLADSRFDLSTPAIMNFIPKTYRYLLLSLALALCFSGCHWLPKSGDSRMDSLIGNLDGDISVARLAERRGNLVRAKEIYHEILRHDPHNGPAHHRLAVISATEGSLKASLEHFQLAQQYMPQPSAELLGDLGYVQYLLGNADAAEVALKRSLELQPTNQRTLNNLGLVTGMRGNTEESLAYFREAVGPAEAKANLAYVLTQSGRADEAADYYHRALEEDGELTIAAKALVQLRESLPPQKPTMPDREMQLATLPGRVEPSINPTGLPNATQLAQSQFSQAQPVRDVVTANPPFQSELRSIPLEVDRQQLATAVQPSRQAMVNPRETAWQPTAIPSPTEQTVNPAINAAISDRNVVTAAATAPADGLIGNAVDTRHAVQPVAHSQPIETSPSSKRPPASSELQPTVVVPAPEDVRLGSSFSEPISLQF